MAETWRRLFDILAKLLKTLAEVKAEKVAEKWRRQESACAKSLKTLAETWRRVGGERGNPSLWGYL